MAPGAVVCLPCSLCAWAGAVFNQPVGSWRGDCLRLLFHFVKAHFLPEESFSPPALILAWLWRGGDVPHNGSKGD